MADSKISQLTAAATIGASDLLTSVQGGLNKKITAEIAGIVNTNTNLTTATIGGLPAGSSVLGDTPTETLNKILFPYQAPAFTAFGISGQANPIEVGDSISGLKTFTWATSNSANIQANSINIYKVTGGLQLLAGMGNLANDGSESYTFPSPIQLITAGSYIWRIEGTNTQLATFIRDYTQNWYWRKFWGTNASATLTETQIEALVSQNLSNATTGNYSFAANAGQYKYFSFQKDLPQPDYLADFKDQSTGFNVAMEAPYLVTVTNSFSIATDYYVYRTTNQLGGAMTIVVSN